jgi:hypothetical protein
MKVRHGWVSNSSSCSFLVVGTKGDYERTEVNPPLRIPGTFGGETQFGRQGQDYKDLGSRLNFAAMLAGSWDAANFLKRIQKADLYNYGEFWDDHDPSDYRDLIVMLRRVLSARLGTDKIWIHLGADSIYLEDGVDLSTDIWHNHRRYRTHEVDCGGGEKEEAVNEDENVEWSYIDHGSSWGEMPCNLSIFESDETLDDFLFRRDSYVASQGDEYTPLLRERLDGQWATIEKVRDVDDPHSQYWNNSRYLKEMKDRGEDW